MKESQTAYGRIRIGTTDDIYAEAVALAAGASFGASGTLSIALSGGSTPQDWYRWSASNRAWSNDLLARAVFTVSDERLVPLASDQSNFGVASRLLLDPLGVASDRRHPWPVQKPAVRAADLYRLDWARRFGAEGAYDVCYLGLGPDTHTASFFPGSALLKSATDEFFVAIDTPEKGWRLTISPKGLQACGAIVVMVTGTAKAAALGRVFREPYDPVSIPAQILKSCADRAVWLVDLDAAAGLNAP